MQQTAVRPRLRGRIHQAAFIAFIPLGVTVVAVGATPAARAACAIYAVGLIALYGVSASYHRYPWSDGARRVMRRLDHSTIFVKIAATYTPMCVIVLDGAWRVTILAVVWGIAAVGITLKVVLIDKMHRAGLVLYIAAGWTAVAALPQLIGRLDAIQTVLLLGGGALFTTGAIVYARRKPDPVPAVFGFHEIYHSFVVAGSLCHYALIFSVARSAA